MHKGSIVAEMLSLDRHGQLLGRRPTDSRRGSALEEPKPPLAARRSAVAFPRASRVEASAGMRVDHTGDKVAKFLKQVAHSLLSVCSVGP